MKSKQLRRRVIQHKYHAIMLIMIRYGSTCEICIIIIIRCHAL